MDWEISKRQKFFFIGTVILILIGSIVLILFNKGIDIGNKDINKATFEYVNYSVVNESLLKANCPAVNIGRCDTFGGEFGVNCYTREVDLFFNIEGISYKDITCKVNDAYKEYGEYNFEKKDSLIYLPVKVDIRKFNGLSVCCTTNEDTAKEVCFNSIGILSVC